MWRSSSSCTCWYLQVLKAHAKWQLKHRANQSMSIVECCTCAWQHAQICNRRISSENCSCWYTMCFYVELSYISSNKQLFWTPKSAGQLRPYDRWLYTGASDQTIFVRQRPSMLVCSKEPRVASRRTGRILSWILCAKRPIETLPTYS